VLGTFGFARRCLLPTVGEKSQRGLAGPTETHYPMLGTGMFIPHPNLADDVNHAIIQSEIEGGVFLHDLPPSTVLHIQTMHHCYTAVLLGGSEAMISGHPEFCPDPVQVAIAGSTWGGSMLKLQYVGRGMHLEFRHPEYATPIVTSPIQEIRDSQPMAAAPRAIDSFSY
jgi:hypothetical protein